MVQRNSVLATMPGYWATRPGNAQILFSGNPIGVLGDATASLAQVYFHCSNSHGRLLDRRVADVGDLFEARDYAEAVARSLVASPDLQDWRNYRLHIWDDLGEEVLVMPFRSRIDSADLGRLIASAEK